MELVQFLRLTGTLLLLGSFVQAFSNSFSGAKQCELVNLKWWTSPTGARATPPFQFLIIPIGGSAIPGMIIDIPDNAETWNKTSGEGSYQLPPIQLSAGSRFLAAMGDGYGFGTGGVSQILAIDGSDDSSCLLNTQHSESSKLFHFPAAPRQCEDFTITWDPSIAVNSRIFIRGYVPSGTAFALDPPPIGASQTFWTVNIPVDTEFVLLFSTGGSEGLDTPLEISPVFKVNGTSSSSKFCFISSSPSSTGHMAKSSASELPPSSMTFIPTTAMSSYMPEQSDEAGPSAFTNVSSINNTPTIIGITTGSIAVAILLAFVVFYVWRNKRDYKARTDIDPEMTQPRPFHLPTSLADIASSGQDHEGGQTPSEGSTSPLYPSRQRRFAVHNRNFRSPPTSSKGRTSEGRQMNEAASTSNLYTTHTVDSSAPGGEVAPTPVTPAENVPEIINRHTDAGPVIMTDNNISPSSPRIIDLPPRYEDAARPTPSLDLTSPQPSQQPSLRR